MGLKHNISLLDQTPHETWRRCADRKKRSTPIRQRTDPKNLTEGNEGNEDTNSRRLPARSFLLHLLIC
jgi:hypothetical protein